jgi:prepilin-type N-terminal cleavage/methylation domain-containing protein
MTDRRLPAQRPKRAHLTQRQRGMTLIELLVTMVILGFVIATLSGALTQISQMLRISTEQSGSFLGRWSQSRVLQDIVGNMALDPSLDQAFQGNASRFELVSLSAPDAPAGAPRRMQLTLQPAPGKPGHTQLFIRQLDPAGTNQGPNNPSNNEPQWLAEYPGRIAFYYLDKQHQEHPEWPIRNGQQSQALPSAILLKDSDSQQAVVKAAGYPGPINPPSNLGQVLMGTR